ncbi:MAG TPA: nuclear transport factor 2 family protein [Solirubrobacteraceae bacterium]|nr:nuclear transport factor 2 family protein [Solirubrobacteraceae bacterium]
MEVRTHWRTGKNPVERYRAAVERRDLEAVGELLAPEIVFHSPVTFHPFVGRDTVTRLLAEVIQVFEDFRFTDELEMDGAHALIFRANVVGTQREIEGIDLLRFDSVGLICDFTVMLRPLSALVPFAQAMGERAQAAGLQTTRA